MSEPTPRKVPYVRLGNSGLKVSRIILGCMSYGNKAWQPWVLGEEEGLKHIKAAYDAGIQTFDTADTYSNGESEIILGKAIKVHNLPREEIVVMTKVFAICARTPSESYFYSGVDPDTLGYVNQHGLSRKHIFDSVKNSLKRLDLDYIDVLQCHRFDDETPIAETMQALHDVVQAGYVRYIGMSSCWAWQFQAMQNYAITNNFTPFISMQNHYNLLYREEEREMMPTLKHFGVGSIPWNALARGMLTRPYDASEENARSEGYRWRATLREGGGIEIINRVEEIATKKNASMAQIAMAWLLHTPGVTAPLVGTTSLEKLHDIIGALDIVLSPEEMAYLGDPYEAKEVLY